MSLDQGIGPWAPVLTPGKCPGNLLGAEEGPGAIAHRLRGPVLTHQWPRPGWYLSSKALYVLVCEMGSPSSLGPYPRVSAKPKQDSNCGSGSESGAGARGGAAFFLSFLGPQSDSPSSLGSGPCVPAVSLWPSSPGKVVFSPTV